MNYRLSTRVVVIVGVFVLLAVGLFVYTLVSAPTEPVAPVVEEVADEPEVLDKLITAKHQYKEGLHTIAGSAELPSPCHRLIAEPFMLDEGQVAEVRFSTLLEGETCEAAPFDAPFVVRFEAPEDVAIQATWNGAVVGLNLVPVGPDEELDTDIYVKG